MRRNPVEVLTLRAPPADGAVPRLLTATLLPFRGFLLYQVRAHAPGLGDFDLLDAPPLEAGLDRLTAGVDDLGGAQSFTLGGAFLVPFANRIRGRSADDGRTIRADVAGRTVALPANRAGGGREPCAIHGLTLDADADELRLEGEAAASARIGAAAFAGRWPSALEAHIRVELGAHALRVRIEVRNVGDENAPVGVGWHPYFRIPSGERASARLRVGAGERLGVNDYDEVFPTGAVEPVAGGRFDFTAPEGRALGDQFLDDCFTGLEAAGEGVCVAELTDPAGGVRVRLRADAPPVRAVQVYAPVHRPFVAIEPQYNFSDPFGAVWRGRDTGMATLAPGQSTLYRASVELGPA